jgi:hypothetical protein
MRDGQPPMRPGEVFRLRFSREERVHQTDCVQGIPMTLSAIRDVHAVLSGAFCPPRDSRTRVRELVARERAAGIRLHAAASRPRPGSADAAPMSCCAPSAPRSQHHDPPALSGLPGRPSLPPHRLGPGRHFPGRLPVPGLRPEADPGPAVQPRPGRERPRRLRRLWPARQLLVGGSGQPDTSLCAACEYRRYLAATGGRDLGRPGRPGSTALAGRPARAGLGPMPVSLLVWGG